MIISETLCVYTAYDTIVFYDFIKQRQVNVERLSNPISCIYIDDSKTLYAGENSKNGEIIVYEITIEYNNVHLELVKKLKGHK